MSARKLTLTALVSLCALVGVFALGSAAAQAAVMHDYLSSITEVPVKGPPPAEEPVAFPGAFEGQVINLAVDSGELYVDELSVYGATLDKFNASSGAFIAQFLSPPLRSFFTGFAVGHGTGETEMYLTERNGRVGVFDAAGKLQGTWNGSDTPAGSFGRFGCFEGCTENGSVAVYNSGGVLNHGLVYVLDPEHNVVDVFEPEAGGGEKYVTQITGPEPAVPFAGLGATKASLAVDQANGDVLVVDGSSTVDVFEATALGEYALAARLTGTPAASFGGITSVAADGASGDIYVSERSLVEERFVSVVDQFSSAGVYLGHLKGTSSRPQDAFGRVEAVAVDPVTGDVYVGDGTSVHVFGRSFVAPDVTTEPVSGVKPVSATFNGTVNPDEAGAATCRFEWGTSTAFGEPPAPCSPASVEGNSPVAVHAVLSLQPDTTYYYRLRASNANGTNPGEAFQDQEFHTPGPGIHQEAASVVTSVSTTLNALIDPDNVATTYYFQYGTSAAYGSSVPAAPGLPLGSGKGDVAVSVHVQGLAPGTVYHYRVVALSEVEGEPLTVEGPDQTFVTQSAGTEITQVDGRAWEMVSPPNKQGALIEPINPIDGQDLQASVEGGGITYSALAPFVLNPAGSRAPERTQVISTRRAPGSWETADITTEHNEGASEVAAGGLSEYKLFSSDLSLGFVEPAGYTPLPPLPAGSERTVYLRAANGEYRALVSAANVPPGTKFGGDIQRGVRGVNFAGASPDLSHIVLNSKAQLTSTPIPLDRYSSLYEWAGGQLQLASVLPNGESTSAILGGGESGIVRHAVSDDGSRLVYQTNSGNPILGAHLDLRDMVRGETVAVDAVQGAPELEPRKQGESIYRTASSDDSRVFFTSRERLTADSTAAPRQGENGEDLYVFEVMSGGSEALAGRLRDLTVDGNAGEIANVRGVIGASEDGSQIYFVANGVLGDAAAHGAVAGGNNLYVERYDAGARVWAPPKFIVALSSGDEHSWRGAGASRLQLGRVTSRVSPDGRYLAFMSERSLTGYENRDANSGVSDEEVFLYDAGTGRVVCASCNPTGARPVGLHEGQEDREKFVDWAGLWGNRWFAGNVPGWTPWNGGSTSYQSRYLSDSGRLFFNSSDALVPGDVNGQADVYEYEPVGLGGCRAPGYGQSASVVYSESVGGCVGLVSAGTSSEESSFVDASETGGDVFFLTLSRLASQDYDTSIDLYDAHECSVSAPCAAVPALVPPPCMTGDACKAGPTPQPVLFGAPSSATFSGAGNIVPSSVSRPVVKPKKSLGPRKCKRGYKKARGRCVRKAKRSARGRK
jgi:hypothetical protein